MKEEDTSKKDGTIRKNMQISLTSQLSELMISLREA